MLDKLLVQIIRNDLINKYNKITSDDDVREISVCYGDFEDQYLTFGRLFFKYITQVFYDMNPTYALKPYGYWSNYKWHTYDDINQSIVEFYKAVPKSIFVYTLDTGEKKDFLSYDERLRLIRSFLSSKYYIYKYTRVECNKHKKDLEVLVEQHD